MSTNQTNSLYIGDLDQRTNEKIIKDFFERKVPNIKIDVKVCYDHNNTTKSLGYGYMNFTNPEDSQKVLNELNYSELPPNGRVCRLMKKQPQTQRIR
jgi:RNA recognition motif-containing protein